MREVAEAGAAGTAPVAGYYAADATRPRTAFCLQMLQSQLRA
jgi:hypothetical protein